MTHGRFPGSPDPAATLWRELEQRLETRFRELNEELRRYPTPIARCDEQLTRLIEQRDMVRAELERIAAIAAEDAAPPPEVVRPFLAETSADDESIAAVRSRLRAVVLSHEG